MTLVAITGGIGAGKSTVLQIFQELGCSVQDADDVAHGLYADEKCRAFQEMTARWGQDIVSPDGCIDRKKVAAHVFQNESERKWLETLLHPAIRGAIEDMAMRLAPRPLFCAIPLLYECGWESGADYVISVWCSPEAQYKRLCGRGWTDEQIQARLKAQIGMDEKLKRADFGIMNDGSLEATRSQCERIVAQIMTSSGC